LELQDFRGEAQIAAVFHGRVWSPVVAGGRGWLQPFCNQGINFLTVIAQNAGVIFVAVFAAVQGNAAERPLQRGFFCGG
jgi:hypothetical protein